jgi:hypothetical protein
MEHFYLSIKNTQRKIEDVRNLFKNLTTREMEILEFEKARAEQLKLERDLKVMSDEVDNLPVYLPPSPPCTPEFERHANNFIVSNSELRKSPLDRVRKANEIIIVENIKSSQAVNGSVVSSTRNNTNILVNEDDHENCLNSATDNDVTLNNNVNTINNNENFQMIQKSEIINFNKMNQLSNVECELNRHVNFLLTSKRREQDEYVVNFDSKMHRKIF